MTHPAHAVFKLPDGLNFADYRNSMEHSVFVLYSTDNTTRHSFTIEGITGTTYIVVAGTTPLYNVTIDYEFQINRASTSTDDATDDTPGTDDTDTSADTGTEDEGSEGIPGFELFMAITAVILVTVIARKKKKHK